MKYWILYEVTDYITGNVITREEIIVDKHPLNYIEEQRKQKGNFNPLYPIGSLLNWKEIL